MATVSFVGSNFGATVNITSPVAQTRRTLLQGYNPGIISFGKTVIVSSGLGLAVSVNRGVAFVNLPLPVGQPSSTGPWVNRVGIGHSAQGLAVVAIGLGTVDPLAGATLGGSRSAATQYYVLEALDDAGAPTWSAPRTSAPEVGINYLTQLPWPNRLTGGQDQMIGAWAETDYVVEGTDRTLNLRWQASGPGLDRQRGTEWDHTSTTDGYAEFNEFALTSDWTIDVEHSGNDGTIPLQPDWRVWFCGPRWGTRAGRRERPSLGGEVQIGRYNPHAQSVASTTLWTNAVGPASGIWTGNQFVVVQGTPSPDGFVFIARAYRTPSSYVTLQVSQPLSGLTGEPAAIRTYLTRDGVGLVVLRSLTALSGNPQLSYTRWRRPTNQWDDWAELGTATDSTLRPTLNNLTGYLNVDRFPTDSAPRVIIAADNPANAQYYYQDLLAGVPEVAWTSPDGEEGQVGQPITLTWSYEHVDGRTQQDWQITRHIKDPLTDDDLPVEWWNSTANTWDTTEVWNRNNLQTATFLAGWQGTGSNGLYSPVIFRLKVRDSSNVESETVDITRYPFTRLAAMTITAPTAGQTITGFTTATAQFPTDPADLLFEPTLFTDGTVFAAEYLLQVHERGKANLVSSGWQTFIAPAGSTPPYEVSHTFQQIPNGTGWITRAQWRQWEYPRSTSTAAFQSFIIQLAPPTVPTVTVRALSDDNPQVILAETSGLVRGGIALRVTVSGTIGVLPGGVTLERRERSRSDHRPLSTIQPTFPLPEPYITGQTYDDYTVEDGVEYEYRARTVNTSGAAIIGAWTPA